MIPALVNSVLLSRGKSTSIVPGANNFVQPFQPFHRRPKLDKSGAVVGVERFIPAEILGACPTSAVFLARTSGLDATHVGAYNALICGLVSDGIWTKLDVLHIYATQDTTTAQLNLVSASYPATLHGSPTFTADRGYTGTDGSTTKYIDTGFNAATASSPNFVQNSAHLSTWSVNNQLTSSGGAMGTLTLGSGAGNMCWPVNSTGDAELRANGPGQLDAIATAIHNGYFVANRSGASNREGYRNAGNIQTITSGPSAPSIAVQNFSIYTLGSNIDGTASGTPEQLAMASIGSSLSSTDVTKFYNRLRTFMTTVGVPGTGTTFNPSDKSANVTLSNGNLTATYTSASDGGVRSISSKTTGKYYVEFTKGSPFNGGDSGLGIALASANLATIGLAGAGGFATFPSGSIYFNGSNTGLSLGATATIIGMAIDLDNQKGWFIGDAGTWNGSGSDNPATNTGGVNLAAIFPGAGAFIVCCSNQNTSNATLNAGDSAFVKTVPSGFTAGWPS